MLDSEHADIAAAYPVPATPLDISTPSLATMDIGTMPRNSTSRFQFCGKALHLTYKTHVPLQALLDHLIRLLGPMTWHSLVHETGTSQVAYDHTHAAFLLEKKATFTSPRKLDYEGIHPHLKSMTGNKQYQAVWTYHLKAPLAILQSLSSPIRDTDWLSQLVSAPSLAAAMKIANVEVKTLRDVQMLRQDKEVRIDLVSPYPPSSWRTMLIGRWRTVFLHGSTGIGKTQWAIAQLSCPLLVSHLDDLKSFISDHHDGIIFDDICLSSIPSNAMIHICDWDVRRSLNVRYGTVSIPAFTRKIITSNQSPQEAFRMYPDEHVSAIMRRLQVIYETVSLFNPKHLPSQDLACGTPENSQDDYLR